MDTLVHLYFNQSELNDEVKTLILSWVTFFKNNWNSLFNVDKEIVLNLEFFLDNKKLINRNAPPNNEVYLHELKKNPEIVLKFMKLALHLLLCKMLDIEAVNTEEVPVEVSEGIRFEAVGRDDACSDSSGVDGIDNASNMRKDKPIVGAQLRGGHLSGGDYFMGGAYHLGIRSAVMRTAGASLGSPFITRDEISDFENDDSLINQLKCDRYKESEIFKSYFLTNRITIYIYNWNKLNKFENLKSEKVNQLVCLRGSVLRVSPIQLLITKLDFICEKCKGIIQVEFTEGKYDTPKKCPNPNCDSRNFHPIRESAKSIEYQKIVLKENKKILSSMNEMGESNVKNLTVTLEVSKFFINSCVPGNYVEVVGILKVISYNNNQYLINGKNSIYNMYVDCLSIFPLSSKKYLNNSCFNFDKVKETKNRLYNSLLWESYFEKMEKKMLLYCCEEKGANVDKLDGAKEEDPTAGNQSTSIGSDPTAGNQSTGTDPYPIGRKKPPSLGVASAGTHLRSLPHNENNAAPVCTQGYRPLEGAHYDATSEIDIKAKTNVSFDASTVNNSIEMNTYEALICAGIGEMLSDVVDTTSGDSQNRVPQFRDSLEKTSTSNMVKRDAREHPPRAGDTKGDTSSMLENLHLGDDQLCMYGDYIDEESLGVVRKRKRGQGDYAGEGETGELSWPSHPSGTNQVWQPWQPRQPIQPGKPTQPGQLIQQRQPAQQRQPIQPGQPRLPRQPPHPDHPNDDHHFNQTNQFDAKVLEFIEDMHNYGKNKFYLLVASLCPRIIMNNYIKAGMLLSLLGGKTIYDEYKQIKRRGNIHILLIGDPGLGKSRILQYVSNIIEKSLFICSTSTSINGLTACAFKDSTNNEYSLEGGALVLSDKGICCIDELDKISLTDQQSFLECMESQCINISKAGIVCNLKTRCSIIAASNPKEGKYNYNKTIFENIKIPFPLLSRFDLVFLLTDKMSEEKDYRISNYLINSNYDAQGREKKKKRKREGETNPRGSQKKGAHKKAAQKGVNNEDHRGDHSNDGNHDSDNSDDSDDSDFDDEDMFSLKNDLLNKCKQINERSYLPVELLGVFIKYCRKCIFPTLSDEAKKYLRKFYLHLRNLSATHSNISSPITIRQLESLIRLCQARARGDLSNVVTLYHAKEVVEIYQKTIFYPLYLKTLNFREKTVSRTTRGKSAAAISNVFKEGIIQLVKQRENKIFNKDLRNLAKSVILSAESCISDEALIHYLNNEGFILYKGGYWQVDPFYLR
ncbi:adenosinetriphosphatase [Plasmodium inui San Antonio 1]|uniref:DNA helicase n=1 Tax=Plasmodium inui San Antonio 1 TaxID=1237626 RepID=W7A5N5_9APIC|nr:adenosinetriphosphatase [Plasmodium inui San Antonio 1]EUD66523.1 adenosinetriphosphatase [Plasmodium inui San Antonio 1]